MNILCLEIGGTHTRAALVGNDGLVEKKSMEIFKLGELMSIIYLVKS